ncbi:MAG: tyrosine-type recombinase/integrase [Syntrophaceae bacterium]
MTKNVTQIYNPLMDVQGSIICNKCRKAMSGKVCTCGSIHCYISLYWKGRNYTFRRDSQNRVLDYREASVTLIRINSEINDPYVKFNPVDWTDSSIRERKFENQIAKWIAEKELEEKNGELSYGTLRDYKGYVRNHYGELRGVDVRDIEVSRLVDLKNSLGAVGLKTRKNIMDALHVFMVWLKGNGVIKEVPAFPDIKGYVEPAYRAMDYQAQWEALGKIPDKHRDIIHFLAETGIRPAEACALIVDNVDPFNGCCTIEKTFSKNRLRHTTKQKETRVIPLSDIALAIVIRNIKDKLPTQWLFINPTTGTHYLSDTLWRIWKQFANTDANLYQGTRHSFGFQLIQNNDAEKVRQLMGHSTVKTTNKYAKVKVTTLRDIVNQRGKIVPIKGSEKKEEGK